MLTAALDYHQNSFDSLLGPDFLPPATVDEFSEEINPTLPPSPDDFTLFYNSSLTDNKTGYNNMYTSQFESQQEEHPVASPTDSTRSADLLDLESVNYNSWDFANDNSLHPNWMAVSQPVHQQTTITVLDSVVTSNSTSNPTKPTSTSKYQTKSAKVSQPAKATKRRNSSQTSEIELQIEIEESTKRAKRCTAPLTEEQKRLRRKELNRLAAQRCRSKRKSHAEVLEDEIDELTKKNRELREKLEDLESTKTELYDVIKFHFANCHK